MKHARCFALILVVAAFVGCASVRTTTEGWWQGLTRPDTVTGQQGSVYYAGSDGLVVHAEASGSSASVGRLTLHQRVTRTQLKGGWAYVSSDGGLKGWVDNAQLVWRLPAAGAAAATPAADSTRSPVDAPAPAATAQPAAPTAEPAGAPSDTAPAAPIPQPAAPVPAVSPAPPPPAPEAAPPRGQPSAEIFDPF